MRIRQTRFISQRPSRLIGKQVMERFIRIEERSPRNSQANEKGRRQYENCNQIEMSIRGEFMVRLRFEFILHRLCVIHQAAKINWCERVAVAEA